MRLETVEAARDVLRRFRLEHSNWQDDQTPVETIAEWLGCEIATFHPHDYPVGTYGFLEPGEQLIWLCRDLTTTLHRFTLAHELGHVILHSSISTGHDLPQIFLPPGESASAADPCQAQDVFDEMTEALSEQTSEALLGPGFTYDPRSQRELAANLFAAELLMPLVRVWELYVEQNVSPERLAELFNVSQSALFNRLTGLLTERPAHYQKESTALPAKSDDVLAGDEAVVPVRRTSDKAYDQFQQAALETPTPALIVAGPGSGKTSTLVGRVEYLIRRQDVHPEQILALTFSRKAAQEMQERLQQVLSDGIKMPTISTFHSFCAELLRTYGVRVGLRQRFELVDEAEGYFLLRQLIEELPLNHYQNLYDPTTPLRDFLKAISRAKDELITPERYWELACQMHLSAADDESLRLAERSLEIAAVYTAYQHRLEQRGDSDFGGLIMLTVQLLRDHKDIQTEIERHYQHILVDEFQDINRASGVLLRLLAGHARRVWVVGDANQAIYGFRGASPANIANFREDYPDAYILPLSRNYRSRPDIVHLADTFRRGILEADPGMSIVQTARNAQSESYVTLAVAPDEHSELASLAQDIQQKLREGYRCRDIVVLCRTRAMVRKVTRSLARLNLPIEEHRSMLEQEHIKNLLSFLLLLTDKSGMGILRSARLTPHPLSQSDIESLLREVRTRQTTLLTLILREEPPLGMSFAGRQSLDRLARIVKNLLHGGNSIWLLLTRYLLAETSLIRELLSGEDNVQMRRMCEDYTSLFSLAHTYDQQQRAAQHRMEEHSQETDRPHPSVLPLQGQIAAFLDYFQVLLSMRQESDGKREDNDEEAEEAPELLRVMTVHASKGLEFPVVYLPGLAQRRFPLQKRYNSAPPPVGMLAPESEGDRAHESGEACLFYVGTTRARDQLILSYSERYGKQSAKRSSYIDALIVGLPEERVQRIGWLAQKDVTVALDSDTLPENHFSSQPGESFIKFMQPDKLRSGQIEDYQICPRRYAYSTIYAFHRSEGTFLSFWQATADTLQALLEQASPGSQYNSQEQVAELFTRAWRERGGDEQPFARIYERHGQEIAEQVRQKLQEQQASNWQLRQNLAVELMGRQIEVSIDRVEVSSQGEAQAITFVRNRFGKSKSKPGVGTRELLYLSASRQHHLDQEVALQSHNLSTGETHEITITSRKEQGLLSELEQALAGIERHDFTPRPDAFTCPSCPFFLICPA